MAAALAWISGASGGIGQALAQTVPWDGARVIGISRGRPEDAIEHLKADLADPSIWPTIGASFHREMEGFDGEHVLSVAPGTVDTAMQEKLRQTPEMDFPRRQKFLDLHEKGNLSDSLRVAGQIWALITQGCGNGSVIDLRKLG